MALLIAFLGLGEGLAVDGDMGVRARELAAGLLGGLDRGNPLLGGLEAYLTRMLGVPCRTAKDPLTCVARGTEKAFTRRDILLDGFERIDAYTQS
jgi:hypothetical protein